MTDLPLDVGADAVIVQMSPCFGGILRTWASDGTSGLWRVEDEEWLLAQQCWGLMQRTQHAAGRFREFGILSVETGALLVEPRALPPEDAEAVRMDPKVLRVTPVAEPGEIPVGQFKEFLDRAVAHSVTSGEIVIVEQGGWGSPAEPYCMSGIVRQGADEVTVVETAPPPTASKIWGLHLVPDRHVNSLTAPATYEALGIVPALMLEAVATWELSPWDLTLTFAPQ